MNLNAHRMVQGYNKLRAGPILDLFWVGLSHKSVALGFEKYFKEKRH